MIRGWVTLASGDVVHDQTLNPNPIVDVATMETKTTGGVTYITQIYTHKDGTKETVTLSYNTYK